MTAPKHHNTLYLHLKSVINQAIPLEYAIRATRLQSGAALKRLEEINTKILEKWLSFGATKTDIGDFHLMETTWDYIQVGISLRRAHGQYFSEKDFHEAALSKINEFQIEFRPQINKLNIPAMHFFRAIDLLNGNKIKYMINGVARCLKKSKKYGPDGEIDLNEFIGKIREPIHLHPAVKYGIPNNKFGKAALDKFMLQIDINADILASDLKRQIREFIYRYAVYRESVHGYNSHHQELIGDFLRSEMKGNSDKHTITRIDGYLSVLSGLYCWDLHQELKEKGEKSPLEKAITDTLSIYPETSWPVTDTTIRKNYNSVRNKIMRTSFQ